MELGLFLILLVNIGHISAGEWETPPFSKPPDFPCTTSDDKYDDTECPNWDFPNDPLQTVYIKFKEELEDPILITYIHCKDCSDVEENEPQIGEFRAGSRSLLGPEIKKEEDGKFSLTINNKLDYEQSEQREFTFSLVLEKASVSIRVKIILIDIDDNPPRIIVDQTPCEIPENYPGETNCTYSIFDPDTVNTIDTVTFQIIPDKYEVNFEMKSTPINKTNADAVLLIKEELDFETMPMYYYELKAVDGAGNNGTALVMIKVKDMNDQPPKWIYIFAMKTFNEHTTQKFNVKARDGDLEINDIILYELSCGAFDKYITIEKIKDGEDGEDGANILVSEIDRDIPEIEEIDNTIKCILIATEQSDNTYNATTEIAFIIQDINDNKPLISINSDQQSPIKLREEEFTTIKLFVVDDKDQGNNAQFDVSLETAAGVNIKIDYTEPFQLIPNNGYRNWEFSISVVNAELLDYDENEDWRHFSLQIRSKDKGDKPLEDTQTIKIDLINLNDEIPVFDKNTDYEVFIPEDAKKDTYILNILAIDKDVGDRVEYKLSSGDSGYKLIEQTNGSVTLYTAYDNVFDYEKINLVLIQISATDTLTIPGEKDNFHTVTQQITVHVIDVNDEKPRINLPYETIKIKEHTDVKTEVTKNITAEDVDTTALLIFSIDWTKSRASKLGVQVQDNNLFKDVFDIKTEYLDENKKGYATGVLTVLNKKKLDYEVFDTILLNIKVEDKNQVINDGTDEGILTILIDDINDNAPEFNMDTITSTKTVLEHSTTGFKIAKIVAKDIDGPGYNEITYLLKEINGTKPGLVKIDPDNGELLVDKNKKIDADAPEYIEYLYYEVTATDIVHRTKEKIKIKVEDLNEMKPYLKTPLNNKLKIKERTSSEPENCFTTVDGFDDDRDKPHDLVTYYINNEITQLSQMYKINRDSGIICAYGNIEWTSEQETVKIYIILEDNFGGQGDSNREKFNFTLTIEDIDNNPPVLPDKLVIESIKENVAVDSIIAQVIATDKDKPCERASNIEYSITKTVNEKGETISKKLFDLIKREMVKPKCEQIADLKVASSLENYYGTITITVQAKNPDTKGNIDTKSYEISVGAYNYKPPKIITPKDSTLILQKAQKAGKQLIAIDETPIKDFEATDDQNGKFEMFFEAGTLWDSNFELLSAPNVAKNRGRLTLKVDTLPKKEYELQIHAYHNGDGNSNNFIDQTIKVVFIDKDQLPGFNTAEAHVKFEENATTIRCQPFPKADDPKCYQNDECLFTTYYHIMNTEEKVFFKTDVSDKNAPQLCLVQDLDREKQPYHYLTIVATNNQETAPPNVPEGYEPLKITVEVLDINDNPPEFETKLFKGGLADTDKIDSVIIKLYATDPDKVDQGKLWYGIEKNSINASDSSLENVKNSAFQIVDNEIKNLFQPTQQMHGYFTFNVKVYDTLNYTDTAEVKIHIISDANRVLFKFSQDIDTVKEKKEQIEDIFSKEFGYSCTIDDFAKKLNETTKATGYITEIKTHFIDKKDDPIEKKIISVQLEDLATVGRLRIRLEDISITLLHVDGVSDTTDDVESLNSLLQILLIVVSVVLGTLCVVLIVAFILRTRSLTKRLNAMTTNVFGSTKSDLNRIGVGAPGTNRHAIEANPVWNEDLENADKVDTMSQSSDGSDLIGVEDKPDFEYDFRRASINPVMQQKMSKRDDDDDISSLPGDP